MTEVLTDRGREAAVQDPLPAPHAHRQRDRAGRALIAGLVLTGALTAANVGIGKYARSKHDPQHLAVAVDGLMRHLHPGIDATGPLSTSVDRRGNVNANGLYVERDPLDNPIETTEVDVTVGLFGSPRIRDAGYEFTALELAIRHPTQNKAATRRVVDELPASVALSIVVVLDKPIAGEDFWKTAKRLGVLRDATGDYEGRLLLSPARPDMPPDAPFIAAPFLLTATAPGIGEGNTDAEHWVRSLRPADNALLESADLENPVAALQELVATRPPVTALLLNRQSPDDVRRLLARREVRAINLAAVSFDLTGLLGS